MLETIPLVFLRGTEIHADGHELLEIAMLADKRLFVAFQRLFKRRHLGFQLPCGSVCLPLREGMVKRGSRCRIIAGIQQIYRHVECRMEAGMQWVHSFTG